MTDTIHAIREEITTHTETREFNKDGKGRTIGARARCGTFRFTKTETNSGFYSVPAEFDGQTRFFYQPNATRDGVEYGAYHYPKHFATAEERDYAVAKYLANAEKRAAKIR